VIREPVPADAVRLGEIHLAGWRWAYHGIVPDQELFVERTFAQSVALWEKRLANPSHTLVWDEGLVKGFCIHHPSRDEDAPQAWEVGALYVEPAFSRQGGGTALVAAAAEAGRAAGYRELHLWVLEANPRARAFYESCGLRPDGTSKPIPEWNGAVELRYTKALG